MDITYELVRSWQDRHGNVNSLEDILQWVKEKNESLKVDIQKIDFSYHGFWHYDEETGYVRNVNNSFFQVAGIQEIEDDHIVREQPIILQEEIGYLGFLCKMVKGTLNFLVQAKVEPGNVNVIQLSPTIQATKSNFTRKHGGKCPLYLDYFANPWGHTVLADQLQSEQSARFYKKRNRNIVLLVDEDIKIDESHKWMTLGQIKECMGIDNLVNMDTRTVLSCLPFLFASVGTEKLADVEEMFHDKALFRSIFKPPDYPSLRRISCFLNDCRMYRKREYRLVPLKSLKGWRLGRREIACKKSHEFKVVYCHIEIENREVSYWEQPLIEALGMAVIGLFTCQKDGMRQFLVRVYEEMGSFDSSEVGPSIQYFPRDGERKNPVEDLFLRRLREQKGVLKDVVLSEEGGRFYHEQNRNVILEIDAEELGDLPNEYDWLDFASISSMIRLNGCVNIQLRNLMVLLDL